MTGPTPLLRLRESITGIVWPPLARGQIASVASTYDLLDSTQWLPPAQIAACQSAQLRTLIAHAARHSRQFQHRLAGAGLRAEDIAAVDTLHRLPLLHRQDIQSAGATFFCDKVPAQHEPLGTTQTSGSTGEPVTVRRTFVNQLYWMATTLRGHAWHHADFQGRFSAIRAQVPAAHERADWGPPTSLLFESGPSQVIPVTLDVQRQFALLLDFEPTILMVYPGVLAAICELYEQGSSRLPGLEMVRTMGETLPPDLRERAQHVLGVRVADSYSSEEVGTIAAQCPVSGLYHIAAETLIVEVLDAAGHPCPPGVAGRVVVTDLQNLASPLLRYVIGDYAEVAGPCPCGRGLPTLQRIVGRERNLILMPDGTRHWPRLGYKRFREIAPIAQYQFIQYARTAIEVRLVLAAGLSDDQEAELRAFIQDKLGYSFDIRFACFTSRLPASPRGKFEEFVCQVGLDRG